MSTPIFKVSDGSTITFSTQGLLIYAILAKPDGQVIKGFPTLNKDFDELAYNILLTNNIIDPSNGEPLLYTVEGKQDQSGLKANNYIYEINRTSLEEVTDETTLNNAKINQKILEQDNQTLKQILESELPPEVRFTNFINSQKSTLKKRLIPFVIDLITPMAPQIIPLVVSQLGISGDTTIDSIKSTAQAKKDEAQAKIDEAQSKIDSTRDQINSAKETIKDKDKLKSLTKKIQTTSIGALLLSQIPIDQLTSLINCPNPSKIESIIKQRNSLATQINNIYDSIKKITSLQERSGQIITAVAVGINLIALAPPNTVPGVFIINHKRLDDALKIAKTVVNTITLSLASFGVFLGTILKFLETLDIILQFCAEDQDIDFKQINDEINALANPTIIATQNSNTNTYKGFTLGVKIDETNKSKYIRRYAVAQNKQGVPILKTDSSFASNPAVLISQLKFIIDSNPNITAE